MADKTTNLNLTLTNDTDATTTTFKQWRNSINGESDSNMQKIDAFAGTTNAALTNKVDKDTNNTLTGTNTFNGTVFVRTPSQDYQPATKKYVDDKVSALNIENGTGDGSLFMNNTTTVKESNDGGEKHEAIDSKGTPTATGVGAFATGAGTEAIGDVSTAEGINTKAGYIRDDTAKSRSVGSHAEGEGSYARSSASHAEGYYTQSLASNSHTEGFFTTVNSGGWSGHAEGRETIVNGKAGHAEGYLSQTDGTEAHAEGMSTKAEGDRAHAEGEKTIAGVKIGDTFNGVTVTDANRINYRASHAEGIETKAYIKGSHAEGIKTIASGEGAHAEGALSSKQIGNTASGKGSHAEGGDTTASGNYSHAEGDRTIATGSAGHAEGCITTAGYRSHAEGEQTVAGGNDTTSKAAHAEGIRTSATGSGSHSEGRDTKATGEAAHAEGVGSQASGLASHAGGTSTIAQWANSTVVGKFNKTTGLSNSNSDPLFIVGNGTSHTHRKNAFEIYTDGTGVLNEGAILTENTYYVDWDTLTGSADTPIITTTNVTVKDKNNSAVTLEMFYSTVLNLIKSNKNNLQVVLRGSVFFDQTIDVKCVATSVSERLGIIQISASVGYHDSTYQTAITNLSIKLNIEMTTEIATSELIVSTYNNKPVIPCLIEGTAITMSDNSVKTIEQIKAGDIVLSYNPITKTKINTIVLAAYKTGSSNDFMTYSFENGSFITAYGIEGYYENTEGAIKDLQKITKQDELITQDLTYTYFYLKKPYFHHGEKKNRYSLIVSNNLYFANGILLGHSPYKKYWGILEGLFTVPNDIKTIYKEECNKYNEFTDFINTKEYQAEVADSYSKLAKANEAIRTYKEKLSETDYKVQKYIEGVLSEEEWQEAKTNRAAWRQVVNDNQELRRSLNASVKTILNKYRKGITAKDLFEESCTKDNESFETIKNYFEVK